MIVTAALLMVASSASAYSSYLTFDQSGGSIMVTYNTFQGYCGFVYSDSPINTSIVAQNINISSTVQIGECPPPPPNATFPPTHVSIADNLGPLPDGTYTVTWTFGPAPVPPVTGTFRIVGGQLVQAAPVLSPAVTVLLGLLLLAIGLALHR